jgi:hypothetical protein
LCPAVLEREVWKQYLVVEFLGVLAEIAGYSQLDFDQKSTRSESSKSAFTVLSYRRKRNSALLFITVIDYVISIVNYFRITTYKTIILPVVSYGCETWSLTLREDID